MHNPAIHRRVEILPSMQGFNPMMFSPALQCRGLEFLKIGAHEFINSPATFSPA